jgi:hypothetical protein
LPLLSLLAVSLMPNKILTGTDYYSEIRGRLGVDISDLPDADIDARSVMNIAENKVIESVPDYASLTGSDADYVYSAAVCMVAAVLAPSMGVRMKKSKKDFDSGFENQVIDWKARSIELIDNAYTFVNLISTQVGADLPIFGVSGPTRANAPQVKPGIYSGDSYLNNV